MNSLTLISFVRHGRVHKPRPVYYGRLPGFRLSEKGSFRLRPRLRSYKPRSWQPSLVALFCARGKQPRSFRRTRTTCITYFEMAQRSVYSIRWTSDQRTREARLDVYAGTPPEYEQPINVLERAQKFIKKARRAYSGQHIVAATHGDLIAFLILWAKSAPIALSKDISFSGWGLQTNILRQDQSLLSSLPRRQ